MRLDHLLYREYLRVALLSMVFTLIIRWMISSLKIWKRNEAFNSLFRSWWDDRNVKANWGLWLHSLIIEVLKNRHIRETARYRLLVNSGGKRLQGYRIKWLSVCGGCLGDHRRWRTWQPAKSCGELANKLWSADVRMGEPTSFEVSLAEYIG